MDAPFTIPFDQFWNWIRLHPDCILRAGTPEAVIYDDEDLHWLFTAEEPATLIIQLLRGKRLVSELFLDPEQVAYVETVAPEREDEHSFELISETEDDRFPVMFFVLVHGWDVDDGLTPGGRVH